MPTQKEQILQYLQLGYPLTPLQALKHFGCFRLASVVHCLKKEGHNISTEIVTRYEDSIGKVGQKKSFAQYKLIKPGHLF